MAPMASCFFLLFELAPAELGPTKCPEKGAIFSLPVFYSTNHIFTAQLRYETWNLSKHLGG